MESERINDSTHGSALQNKIPPEPMTAILMNHVPVLPAIPALHAVEGGEGVEEHVEQPVVEQDVCQLGAGVEELQQHAQDVVRQSVLIQGVLDETQHRDNAALSEGGDVFHFLQIQTRKWVEKQND